MAMVTEPLPARRRGEPRRRGRGWCRWAGRGMRHGPWAGGAFKDTPKVSCGGRFGALWWACRRPPS